MSLINPLAASDWNVLILEQVRSMPSGGGYGTDLAAHAALASAVSVENPPRIDPEKAQPSYCSGATYLVFLKTLAAWQQRTQNQFPASLWPALAPRLRADGKDTLPDGDSAWGRWNANGPGTARLFAELGIGRNFTALEHAKAGDFLKIFWTDAVGKKERGHSVIFLGTERIDGVEHVRFWSSNQPEGYGEKSVARTSIARMIFSRLENPGAIQGAARLKPDEYLASLLRSESSYEEALRRCGIKLDRK